MIVIEGKYNRAIAYVARMDLSAEEQIRALCDQSHFKDSRIRIMPDVHAGKGCTIGTTMTIHDKVVPNMVGVDIGCGMETVLLEEREIDFERLDRTIRAHVPSGRMVRGREHSYNERIDLKKLRFRGPLGLDRARLSIGTLGGGNHFIEVDRDDAGALYLVIHSGSRHLGTEIADGYQRAAYSAQRHADRGRIDALSARLKREGRESEIEQQIKAMRARAAAPLPRETAYVEGKLFDDYIHDMRLMQEFAKLNRKAMADVILSEMDLRAKESFTTIHNYIDADSMILRKGAVSAKAGEKLLIPINMRDGALICTGLGNNEWNQSAPHGAGRLLSRKEARRELSIVEFRDQMRGVFSTSVSEDTLDESPMAYKGMETIVSEIGPTARVEKVIVPVYNFKASE